MTAGPAEKFLDPAVNLRADLRPEFNEEGLVSGGSYPGASSIPYFPMGLTAMRPS